MRLVGLVLTAVLLVAIMVLPLDMPDIALGQKAANTTRILPDIVQGGETFNITLTFTAPADGFNSITLRDTAPDGWNVSVDKTWCTPNAGTVNAEGARASLTWNGPYPNGTNFTVVHKVTVPYNTSPGNHSFNVSEYENFLSYHIGGGEVIRENITGDSVVEVILFGGTCTLEGHVTFAGRGDPPNDKWIEIFTVRFFNSTTRNELPWSPLYATTNSSGYFTITNLPAGIYDIGIKNWTCLSEMVYGVVLN